MNLLLYEGLEGTGKSTLKDKISPRIHNDWLSIERWIHTHVVHQYYLGGQKKEVLFDFITTANRSASPFDHVVLVILEVDYNELAKRHLALGMNQPDKMMVEQERQLYYKAAGDLACVDWLITLDGTTRLDVLITTLERFLFNVREGAANIADLKFFGKEVYSSAAGIKKIWKMDRTRKEG